jgi:hypothetical protein
MTQRIVLTFLAMTLGFFMGATLGFGLTLLLGWLLSFIPVLRDDGFILPNVLILFAVLLSVASALTCGIYVYRLTGPAVSQPSRFEVLPKNEDVG